MSCPRPKDTTTSGLQLLEIMLYYSPLPELGVFRSDLNSADSSQLSLSQVVTEAVICAGGASVWASAVVAAAVSPGWMQPTALSAFIPELVGTSCLDFLWFCLYLHDNAIQTHTHICSYTHADRQTDTHTQTSKNVDVKHDAETNIGTGTRMQKYKFCISFHHLQECPWKDTLATRTRDSVCGIASG